MVDGRQFPWNVAASTSSPNHPEVPPMSVRAIFFVVEVGKVHGGAGKVRLSAATKGDYKQWSKFTPSGSIEFTCLNERATAWFDERLGKDVAIGFDDPTEADLAPGT